MKDIQNACADLLRPLLKRSPSEILWSIDKTVHNLFTFENYLNEQNPLFLEENNTLEKLYKIQEKSRKESGVLPLCIALESILWTPENQHICTALILQPIQLKYFKLSKKYEVLNYDELRINPLFTHFLQEHGISFQLDSFKNYKEQIEELLLNNSISFTWSEQTLIGAFHIHRYTAIRELDVLQSSQHFSEPMQQLFGHGIQREEKKHEHIHPTLYLDVDQYSAVSASRNENLVLHGPPGTGKSQTIVGIISERLRTNEKTLVVSEKRVALEVVYQRLQQLGLSHFVYLVHSETKTSDFLDQLKKTWNTLETLDVQPKGIYQFTSLLTNLETWLDKWKMEELVGGVSLIEALELYKKCTSSDKEPSFYVPDLNEYLRLEEKINLLNKHHFDLILTFKADCFGDKDLDKKLNLIQEQLNNLKKILDLNPISWSDLTQFNEVVHLIHLIQKHQNKLFFETLLNQQKHKNWHKFVRDYTRNQSELERTTPIYLRWKIKPTEKELAVFQQKLNGNKLQKWRVKKEISNYITVSYLESTLSIIEETLTYYSLKKEEQKLQEQAFKWGIYEGFIEVKTCDYLFQQLQKQSIDKINYCFNLTEDERNKLISNTRSIKELYESLHRTFHLNDCKTICGFIETVQTNWTEIQHVLSEKEYGQSTWTTLFRQAETKEELNYLVLKGNLRRYAGFINLDDPDFEQQLKRRLEQLNVVYKEDNITALQEIYAQRIKQFRNYHTLLNTDIRKLDHEKKEIRKRLKIGKRILVQEWAKTKQHPSLRELMQSEARLWIDVLMPVWMTIPSKLADHFELKTDLFDQCVLDEASQITLQNALGALQRSKCVTIAGDEQQMSPHQFFQSTVAQASILDIAQFYFANKRLTYHYRSKHKKLIEFSNIHFYQNALKVENAQDAVWPIQKIEVPFGRFIQQMNEQEAKAVAKWINGYKGKETIGLIANSELQLNLIRTLIESTHLETLDNAWENGKGFCKTIDQVQGDEADLVLVSFGYGPDATGKLRMNFGPLNRKDGMKRLNVVLTRAKMKQIWFVSFPTESLKISLNPSIDLLRQWFVFLDKNTNVHLLKTPKESQVDHTYSSKKDNAFQLFSTYQHRKMVHNEL